MSARKLIGGSVAMAELRQELRDAAASDLTVLLLGETGTGKGVAAELLHAWSRRRERPWSIADRCTRGILRGRHPDGINCILSSFCWPPSIPTYAERDDPRPQTPGCSAARCRGPRRVAGLKREMQMLQLLGWG